jgi:hypothetical protein
VCQYFFDLIFYWRQLFQEVPVKILVFTGNQGALCWILGESFNKSFILATPAYAVLIIFFL